MLNKILTVSTLALCLSAFSARAQINQDVYVDYSVLDDLAGTANPRVHNQPLFPEVKKTAAPAVKKHKKIRPAKSVVKKNAPVTPPVEIKEETVKIEVIEKKAETPVVKPVVEPVKSLEPEPMTVKPLAPVETPAGVPVVENAVSAAETPTAAGEPVEMPAPADQPETNAPRPQDLPAAAVLDRKIIFADDEAGLSDANKQKIDSILQGFGEASDGKIAINSYNYDDGNDIFKKKRQSLDRAIAVRTYLLSKNYKNFSIKVVNVTDDDSKKNLVEIEEIK